MVRAWPGPSVEDFDEGSEEQIHHPKRKYVQKVVLFTLNLIGSAQVCSGLDTECGPSTGLATTAVLGLFPESRHDKVTALGYSVSFVVPKGQSF